MCWNERVCVFLSFCRNYCNVEIWLEWNEQTLALTNCRTQNYYVTMIMMMMLMSIANQQKKSVNVINARDWPIFYVPFNKLNRIVIISNNSSGDNRREYDERTGLPATRAVTIDCGLHQALARLSICSMLIIVVVYFSLLLIFAVHGEKKIVCSNVWVYCEWCVCMFSKDPRRIPMPQFKHMHDIIMTEKKNKMEQTHILICAPPELESLSIWTTKRRRRKRR